MASTLTLNISDLLIFREVLVWNMELVERINLVIKQEGYTRPMLEKATGIKAKRWENMSGKIAKPYAEELEALGRLWPEYAYWLITGSEIPEAGQISPMTKKSIT